MNKSETILIATRGSALAIAQANMILAQCQAAFPKLAFEIKIFKTTGDKLQTASMAQESKSLPKGLFTKELEVALLQGKADLAVHSLKDLPTELPAGLKLGAVAKRADVRDVLIYRDAKLIKNLKGYAPLVSLKDFPDGATIATSSTRRKAQLLAQHPTFKVVEIRGNVSTRMQKVAGQPNLDATVLALAGLTRLKFTVSAGGRLKGDDVPDGLLATVLDTEVMLPCVGQGAIGIEIRENDDRLRAICEQINHSNTFQCVTAERAFLSAMGGGCQSPVGAYAEVDGDKIRMRAVSFVGTMRQAAGERPVKEPVQLGQEIAATMRT